MNHAARSHFVIALILLIIAGTGYYFWFSHVSSLSDRASALTNEIDLKSQDSARSAQAKNALAALSASEASIQSRFIAPTNIVPYIESVETTGKNLGAAVKVVSVAEDDSTPVGHLTLTLTIDGSFEDVQRTIGVLENEPVATTLGALTFDTTPTTGTSSAEWTASTILTVGLLAGASGSTGLGVVPPEVQAMVSTSSAASTHMLASTTPSVAASSTPSQSKLLTPSS